MANFNCDDPSAAITWEEPRAVFWDGDDCKTAPSNRKTAVYPGTYNCESGLCNNTSFNGFDNNLDGMWLPPNQYAWLYKDYQKGQVLAGRDGSDRYEETTSWTQGDDANTVKKMCRNGGVVENINYAGYGIPNAEKTDITEGNKNLTGHWGIRNMVGNNAFRFESADSVFGDPVSGKTKTVVARYSCAKDPIYIYGPPTGVYGPGYYNTFSDTGKYDNDAKYLPDKWGLNNNPRIDVNSVDTITIRRSRPWKDHLRECCFQTSKNPMDKDLCGKFDGKTAAGRQECKNFLTECKVDDVKFGGKCYDLCKDNPDACDDIKTTFCREHPSDPYCDCINYQSRPVYKFQESKNPEVKAYPRSCIEPKCRIEDQNGIFITNSIKQEMKDAGACANLNLAKTEITGSHNILEAGAISQDIKSSQVIEKPVIPQVTTTGLLNNTQVTTTGLPNNTQVTTTGLPINTVISSEKTSNVTSEQTMDPTLKLIIIILFIVGGIFVAGLMIYAITRPSKQYTSENIIQPTTTPTTPTPTTT
jgi:hypothetical protein